MREHALDDLAIVDSAKLRKRGPSVMISRIRSLRRVPKTSRTKARAAPRRAAHRTSTPRRLSRDTRAGETRADQFLEQRLLVGEVEIDRGLHNPGPLRDVLEPRARKSARCELVEGRRQDRGTTLLGCLECRGGPAHHSCRKVQARAARLRGPIRLRTPMEQSGRSLADAAWLLF